MNLKWKIFCLKKVFHFEKMYNFWNYLEVPNIGPFLHYFTALAIIDTVLSIYFIRENKKSVYLKKYEKKCSTLGNVFTLGSGTVL